MKITIAKREDGLWDLRADSADRRNPKIVEASAVDQKDLKATVEDLIRQVDTSPSPPPPF